MADEVAVQWTGEPSQPEAATQFAPSQEEVAIPWTETAAGGPETAPTHVTPSLTENLTNAFGTSLYGQTKKAAAMAALNKEKPGTPGYKAAEQKLQDIANLDVETPGIGGLAGNVLGGSIFGLSDLLTGGGATHLSTSADEYLRRIREGKSPQQAMELANKAGMAGEMANILSGVVGGGKTRLGTAAKQAVIGGATGTIPTMVTEQPIKWEDVAKQAAIGGVLGGALHQRVMEAESGGNQKAVSPKGAVGVMQIMPETGPRAAQLAGLKWDATKFKNDANYNAALGKAYLDHNVQIFGDEVLGTAAYNAGPGNVNKWIKQFGNPVTGEISMGEFINKIPFKETRDYVRKIFPEIKTPGELIAQRSAQQLQEQPELFGSYTGIEDIGLQRQLAQEAESGQLPFDFLSPTHDVGFRSPIINPKRSGPIGPNKIVPGVTLESPLRFQEKYQEVPSYALPHEEIAAQPQLDFSVPKAVDVTKPQATREPLPIEREINNRSIIDDALNAAKVAGHTEDIGRIERELVPVTDIAKAQKNPVMDTALALIEREGANAKDLFRKDVLGEHFTANPLKSGHEIGGTGMAEWLNAPKKEQIAVLEKYKQFEGMDIPVTQELLGASNREWHLYQNLRVGLDDIARKNGIEVASNYLPKSRIGDWGVVATGPNGYHFESATNKLKLNSIISDLKKNGYNIVGSGLKDELYNKQLIPGLGKRVVADHNKSLGDLFAGHREEAEHIPGWSGQRNTEDLLASIAQYTKRAEFDNVRDRLVQVDKALRDSGMAEQYPRMYERLREHMDQMIGMGFIHQHEFGGNIIRTAQKHFGVVGDLIKPTAHGTARVFNSMKVMAAPARHIVAGTLGNMQTAGVFIAEAAGKYGINTPKFLERQAASTLMNTMGRTPEHLRPVVDRALRSGYLLNSADITGLTVEARGNKVISTLKELAHDPGRAGRWDLKARKDFFLGTYDYALKDMKLSPENAFHLAGKWTREAFVGTRPQDRSLWIQRLGAFTPVMASLTTYANSLAGKLYSYSANRKGATAPMLTIFGTSLALAGLRGTPLSDLGEVGVHIWNMLTSNKDEADKRVASFDAFMLDLEKQYPQMKWVTSGLPSAVTGVDLSRSLNWPGLAQLVPGWEAAKSAMAGQHVQISAPIESMMDVLSSVNTVASAYARGEELGDYEKQRVIQSLLPRQFGQFGKTTDVLNSRDEKIGEVSPEDLRMGNIFAGRSLAEAEVRGQEANVQERLRGQQERIKLADQRLIKTLTTPQANPSQAIENWVQSAMKFGEQGIISDPSKIIEGAFNREMGRMTNPQERAVLAKKFNEVLLRQKVGQ